MKTKVPLFMLAMLLLAQSACHLFDPCNGIKTEQRLKFGHYQVNITSPKDTLEIGDSIHVSMVMPHTLFDSISQAEAAVEEIEISFYVTRDTEAEKDTPLIYIFDQYFAISLNQGEMFDPYHFKLERNETNFSLDFYYICKRSLTYYIPIQFHEIVATGIDITCMSGNPDTWNAQVIVNSNFNTFANHTYPEYFGFIVK